MYKSLIRCSSSLAFSLLALSVLFSCPASAQVFEVDSDIFGSGTLTRDTAQGLDFLDLEDTFGRSFQDISSELGAGGEFAGFRYATEAEIRSLVDNYNSLATPPETPRLTALLDVSFEVGLAETTTGLSGDTVPGGGIQVVNILEGANPPTVNLGAEFAVDDTNSIVGSFLVTPSPVPEPNSISLCVVLFMSMLARRKKQLVSNC